jgi:drug/metabolite transporter (DMT)-like permease
MLRAEVIAITCGLASALTWGAGDFSGGLASKRMSVLGVLALGQVCGLLLLISLALLWGESFPTTNVLLWSVVAGYCGVVGLIVFYHALSIGQMSLVAPLSAVLTAAVPTAVGLWLEGLPSPLTLWGFGLALVGVWILAGTGGRVGSSKGLGLAILAGFSFGCVFVLLDQAGDDGVFWPLAIARTASLSLVLPLALVRRGFTGQLVPRTLVLAMVAGMLDVIGNVFFLVATQAGRLDIAAILSSMYPASTVLLAMFVLGERASRLQRLGIVVMLAAIGLIAA